MLNNFWTKTTPYRITYNNVHIHVFHVFNFHTSQAIQKYFNNEIFPIYSISNHMFDQKGIVCDCLYTSDSSFTSVSIALRLLELGCSTRFDCAQFQLCGHTAPDCARFQYIIGEHAHYSLINIPEA